MTLSIFWREALANKLLNNQWWWNIEEAKNKVENPILLTLWNTTIEQVIWFVEDLMDCDEED